MALQGVFFPSPLFSAPDETFSGHQCEGLASRMASLYFRRPSCLLSPQVNLFFYVLFPMFPVAQDSASEGRVGLWMCFLLISDSFFFCITFLGFLTPLFDPPPEELFVRRSLFPLYSFAIPEISPPPPPPSFPKTANDSLAFLIS